MVPEVVALANSRPGDRRSDRSGHTAPLRTRLGYQATAAESVAGAEGGTGGDAG